MATDIKSLIAFLTTAEAIKSFDSKDARAIAPDPLSAEDIATIAKDHPEDKWPDAFRRTVRLGGTRLNQIDTEADTLLGTEEGALLKATKSVVAAKLADEEIAMASQRAVGASDATHRDAVQKSALRALKKWSDQYEAAKKQFSALYQDMKGLPVQMGLSPEDLTELRESMAGVAKYA